MLVHRELLLQFHLPSKLRIHEMVKLSRFEAFGSRGNVDMLPRIGGRGDLVPRSEGQRWRGGVIEPSGLHSCAGFPINRESRSFVTLGHSLRTAGPAVRQYGIRSAGSRRLVLDRGPIQLEFRGVVPHTKAALLNPDSGVRMLGFSSVIERRRRLQRRKRLRAGELWNPRRRTPRIESRRVPGSITG
jgi:hypothetical protein